MCNLGFIYHFGTLKKLHKVRAQFWSRKLVIIIDSVNFWRHWESINTIDTENAFQQRGA